MVAEELDFLEIKEGDTKVRLNRRWHVDPAPGHAPNRHFNPIPSAPAPTAPAEPVDAPVSDNAITTPLAGVFYRASSPTTPPFAKEGDVVESGQTLCIVEAMKVMNEIKAEARCKIVKIVAENARAVTPGQALFLTEPA